VARARKLAADSERAEVASEVRALVARSAMSKQDFAERIGTSRSRLSTYMSGQVVPSATLMVRMRRVALHAFDMATRAATQHQRLLHSLLDRQALLTARA
jgi:transcriptional regulator with XRE-family HTH domain